MLYKNLYVSSCRRYLLDVFSFHTFKNRERSVAERLSTEFLANCVRKVPRDPVCK